MLYNDIFIFVILGVIYNMLNKYIIISTCITTLLIIWII